ncbi:MAG: orotate phosphoribosyltransferase [Deltaproteobacteria bacterium RIFCSPHIGHO2_12_FULL_43_9]|nr:MAG: orotate phosphoribosyltransferase [Deltaproteobacteria bacterium RIFCSPHIGHO2_12_FULL_43_9]
MTDTATKAAKLLLEAGCVTVNVKEPFRYTSGVLSPIYCDNRLLISDLNRRRTIIGLWGDMLKSKNIPFDLIAGTAMAGIPHASWLSDLLDKPMIYIRNEQKGHGKRNKIEGRLEKGATVLVVDDLITTGGSSLAAVEAIREAGGKVAHVTSIFSYQLRTALDNFTQANCTLHPLSTFQTLITLATESKHLKKDEATFALEWAFDPQSWGEKFNQKSG